LKGFATSRGHKLCSQVSDSRSRSRSRGRSQTKRDYLNLCRVGWLGAGSVYLCVSDGLCSPRNKYKLQKLSKPSSSEESEQAKRECIGPPVLANFMCYRMCVSVRVRYNKEIFIAAAFDIWSMRYKIYCCSVVSINKNSDRGNKRRIKGRQWHGFGPNGAPDWNFNLSFYLWGRPHGCSDPLTCKDNGESDEKVASAIRVRTCSKIVAHEEAVNDCLRLLP